MIPTRMITTPNILENFMVAMSFNRFPSFRHSGFCGTKGLQSELGILLAIQTAG